MSTSADLDIFCVTAPGLEPVLAAELEEKGFAHPQVIAGGVSVRGGWPEVWRANLELRGAVRVLARIAAFRVQHLAQLDKRARRVEWSDILSPGVAVRVEATCRKSRIYHSGAAAQRIETAIAAQSGAPISREAALTVKARIENDLCTISIDTSGEPLHKRGHKQAVNAAPMRETMAALFLRASGYDGTGPVLDPMCGSGTFVIEAAEIAAGLHPGRSRSFAFEHLRSFDPDAWAEIARAPIPAPHDGVRFWGSDRDAGAVEMSRANAGRAGVAQMTGFAKHAISELTPPDGPPGLVIVNPPYGARVGDKARLGGLYRAFGQTMRDRFSGWRVALITSEDHLARATGLPFEKPGPWVDNGGLRIRLWQAGL